LVSVSSLFSLSLSTRSRAHPAGTERLSLEVYFCG
jgi:hypothetical protein